MTCILVTGGAGYVGSTLVPMLLQKGYTVRVLDILLHGGQSLLGVWPHPGFEFQRDDIRNSDAVHDALRGVDAVVHLAAIVGDPACARQPDLAREVNLEASLMLLDQCRNAGVGRFISASTCSNYGKTKNPDQFVDESSELLPVSLYAETKVSFEKVILDPSRCTGLLATSLRLATVFGVSPRMRFDLTVNEFTMELLTKKRLVIYGEQFWRPYVHVRDVAGAILLTLEAPREKINNQVFNVGSNDQNYKKKQLVEMMLPFTPDARIEYVHQDEDPRDYRVSFTKIKKILGFQRTLSVLDGIREIVSLVENQLITNFDHPKFRN